jgi:hypothetical protein
MERLSRASDKTRVKGIIYGRPGAGKTILAATAAYHPDMRDVLFIDREGGMLSVTEGLPDLPDECMPLRHRVHSVADVEAIFWQLKQGSDPQFKSIKTVVIDTASELFNLDLEHTIKENMTKDPRRKNDSIDDPQPGDYGAAGRRIARVIRWLRDLDVNLIVLAHTDEITTKPAGDKFSKVAEESKIVQEVTVGISPMARRLITGFMDFVWLLHVDENGQRWILTQKSGPYFAKTRGPLFADRIGKAIKWNLGDPLLSRVYQTILDKKPFANPNQKEE